MCAKFRSPTGRSVQTPEALAVLRAWLEGFDDATRQRGQTYYEHGHVEDVRAAADHYVRAAVTGQETYEVTLFLTQGRWNSRCTCPVARDCKHVYAAGLAWIAKVETGAAQAADLTPTPADLTTLAPTLFAPPPRREPKKTSFREKWAPILAEKLGRPLLEGELRQISQLAAVFADMRQRGGVLHPYALLNHGFAYTPPAETLAYGPAFHGWWTLDQPPADPWALWQYIACDYERQGRPIPEVFRPMTDTSAVHAALDERLVKEEVDVWRRALGEPPVPPRATAALGIVAARARLAPNGSLHLEVRTGPDQPWKAPTQNWTRQLATVRPADLETLPPADAALMAAIAAEARLAYTILTPKSPLPAHIVAALFRTTAARGAIVLPDERPFAIEAEPLVLEAVASPSARQRLDLQIVTQDGRLAADAALIAREPESLYLFEGRVWRGPPPTPARQLPVAALSDPPLLARLRALGLRLPEKLNADFRHVTLTPRVRCWLRHDDETFGAERLYVELLAKAEQPPCAQMWTGTQGWQWAEGATPPARRTDEPIVEFDLTAAQAVSQRFTDFRLTWNHWARAWTRTVGREFPDEFLAWHATLPPGTDIDLSPELAGLFGSPVRGTVDFSAIPVGGDHDWFDLTVALRVEDATLSAEEIALLLKARGKWVRLPGGGWRRLDVATREGTDAALDRLGLSANDVFSAGKPVAHRLHALQLAGEAGSFESRDAGFAAALRARAAALSTRPAPPLPASLTATLRPYQTEGFRFLAHLSANGFGGVLADDMGLGKTVQTLAWLLHLADTHVPGPKRQPFRALIVCPKSVTHGWLAETARFAPALAAVAFTPALTDLDEAAAGPHLLIANYTQLRLHAGRFQSAAWDAVVLDEGQFIKNPSSRVASVAYTLPSRHRLVLTGTPIENRLTDLWSLFAFAQPGLLGTQTSFRRQYDEDDPAALTRLHRRVHHFLLRRTKAQAAPDLPMRTEDDVVVELEPAQRKLYDAELKRARAQLLGLTTNRALDAVRFNVLASLLRLRQICCHPALIDAAHAELPSAKLDALVERLAELRDEGHQVLVFSQFVEMLKLIHARLDAAGIGHLMLTGATENRAELVEQFQSDRSKTVFLLSLKAAGFGLNLTAASYVFLYDPWWNPAVEAQAIDRTHRIGQTRHVMAYRILAADTVEQKIRALQHEKSALAAAVVQEESLAKVLDLESLRRILA